MEPAGAPDVENGGAPPPRGGAARQSDVLAYMKSGRDRRGGPVAGGEAARPRTRPERGTDWAGNATGDGGGDPGAARTSTSTGGGTSTSSRIERAFRGLAGLFLLVLLAEIVVAFGLFIPPFHSILTQTAAGLEVLSQDGLPVMTVAMDMEPAAAPDSGVSETPATPATPETKPAYAAQPASTFVVEGDPDPSAFANWCAAAACAPALPGGDCEGLEAGLMSGVDADGRPVLPLPDAFCGAMTMLSDAECLCDPALEALSNAFTMTPILQSLCPGARWVSQRQGNC